MYQEYNAASPYQAPAQYSSFLSLACQQVKTYLIVISPGRITEGDEEQGPFSTATSPGLVCLSFSVG